MMMFDQLSGGSHNAWSADFKSDESLEQVTEIEPRDVKWFSLMWIPVVKAGEKWRKTPLLLLRMPDRLW
jgi:hypothetical protein